MAYEFEESGRIKKMTAEELATADAKTAIVVLDQGIRSDGEHCWAYVAVRPSMYEAFLDVIKSGQPKLYSDYGMVLRYGVGETVPTGVKEEMKNKHGFDNNFLANLEQEVRAAQTEFMEQKENKRIGSIVAMLKEREGNME